MKNLGFNIGLVGATGVVGQTFVELLLERKFPVRELRAFASEQSKGQEFKYGEHTTTLRVLEDKCFDDLDIVFFSSGDPISLEWAPKAVQSGAHVVDNSASFRMAETSPLVVPEINGSLIKNLKSPTLIANPNCSTIQMVLALNALKKFGLSEVRVATYQAVSGAGKEGVAELLSQIKDETMEAQIFSRRIAYNVVPQIGGFNSHGYSSEEEKIRRETKKILDLPKLKVAAFTVRVPVLNVHSECVWVQLESDPGLKAVCDAFSEQDGLINMTSPEPATQNFATPLEMNGSGLTSVGRLRKEPDLENTYCFWVVSDNLRKGAALNGIQIAEALIADKMLF